MWKPEILYSKNELKPADRDAEERLVGEVNLGERNVLNLIEEADTEKAGELFNTEEMKIGETLTITTKNTIYLLKREADGFYMSGNQKYCPKPTKVIINGSTFGGSMLQIGIIQIGLDMEFIIENNNRIVTSSKVESVIKN